MAEFAEIDNNNNVLRVVTIPDEQQDRGNEFLSVDLKLGGTWIQTYCDGEKRKNYAGIGFKYDKEIDAFIETKPSKDHLFNEESCKWESSKSSECKKQL